MLIGLLRDGELAWGERERTNVHINNRAQFKYTFRFEDELGRPREATGRTVHTEAVEAQPRAAILYAPHRPSVAMV